MFSSNLPDVHTLWCRHNGRNGVSSQQPHHCLLNRLFRHRSNETSKLRVTGLCVGNSPVAGEFPAQMASDAENVSIWWRHNEFRIHYNIVLEFVSVLLTMQNMTKRNDGKADIASHHLQPYGMRINIANTTSRPPPIAQKTWNGTVCGHRNQGPVSI